MKPYRYQLDFSVPHQRSTSGEFPILLRVALVLGISLCVVGCPSNRKPDTTNTVTEQKDNTVKDVQQETFIGDATFDVVEEEVEFVSTGFKFSGTVFKPDSVERPARGVVIIHDWGPVGREGIFNTAFGLRLPVEIAAYRSIADQLARDGMYVLLYDKRTCTADRVGWCSYNRDRVTKSLNTPATALLADAKAAIAELRKQPGIDEEKIAVLGHGLGADIAAMTIGEPGVDRIVGLAPQPTAPDKIVVYQSEVTVTELEKQLATAPDNRMKDVYRKRLSATKKELAAQKQLFPEIRSGNKVAMAFGRTGVAWLDFLNMHDMSRQKIETGAAPVLWISGGNDFGYPEGEAPSKAKVVAVPAMTHLLVDTGKDADPSVLSPKMLEALKDFLRD